MGDEGEIWNAAREQARKHKENNRIVQMALLEYAVKRGAAQCLNQFYQYRFWGWLDVYPSNKKWHDLKTGKRGRYVELGKFLDQNKKRYQ